MMTSTTTNTITVATCNLNQWAMDFDGNLERIWQSCQQARAAGAVYRLGPELEITGYGCEDHFYEMDTIHHAWESLTELLWRGATDDLLCDFGMPCLFRGARYNCRFLCLNRRILLVRPKLALADNGNYRESRYFTAYQPHCNSQNSNKEETIVLPTMFQEKFGQCTAPFGIQALRFPQDGGGGLSIGCESCEELWTPAATHIAQALQGVELVGNGSGSHHELRKLNVRLDLAVQQATRKCGGIYCYANQRGCDGGRLYFDGGAFIAVNGQLLAQASQFSVQDVEVVTATIDLDDVRGYRAAIPSTGVQSAALLRDQHEWNPFIDCTGTLRSTSVPLLPSLPLTESQLQRHCPEEECCLGPACWLWDYLRRSGASGFFLPLSGGADSSSVAAIVGAMCSLVVNTTHADPHGPVAEDCRRVCRMPKATTVEPRGSSGTTSSEENATPLPESPWVPATPQDLAHRIFHTTFMGTTHSSAITKSRARRLAENIGSYHLSITIDTMVQAVLSVFVATTGRTPQYESQGGTYTQDLALQNIQARLRMVTAYLYAQLLPWVRGSSSGGFLLVLGSANVDEGLRGYMTKYDCSSADLNPIGAISKGDLKRMLLWASQRYNNPVLAEVAAAPPTAELRPQSQPTNNSNTTTSTTQGQDDEETREHSQLDEDEMGMTYDELGHFGKLRKLSRCGPVSM